MPNENDFIDAVMCERCHETLLVTCPRCQKPTDNGERYCSRCDWCEVCGRSGLLTIQ
jgi:hypothetical protein